MKKIILFALSTAFAVTASAEGYQVNTLSAKQLGMAHTGVSQKLNSESLWFNPAAAVFQEDKFTVAAGVTGIMPVATFVGQTSGVKTTTDNEMSTPLYFNANYKINDDLSVGLNFNTPYGSSMSWGDSWEGAHLVQDISLATYNAQPTISYKFMDGKLSVGAGLMIAWGSFSLSKSALPVGDMGAAVIYQSVLAGYTAAGVDTSIAEAYATAAKTQAEAAGENPLASVEISGDSEVKVGVNIGALYNINDKWSIGASYRTNMMMEVTEGETAVSYYNEVMQEILSSTTSALEGANFSASLPLPATFTIGATYYPTEQWTISADLQLTEWNTYDALNVDFVPEGAADQNAEKNYKDALAVRLGAQYDLCKSFTARAGLYYDGSPVEDDFLSPETPSTSKLGYTCGVSIRPISKLSIDLAYAYISSLGGERTDCSCPCTYYGAFAGDYEATANVVSVGLSWGF
ncbi:MAG: outer membrane protein transport protein [Rikenellaceae bacterium]